MDWPVDSSHASHAAPLRASSSPARELMSSISAEDTDSPAAESEKPVDKTVPISREKIATDDDGADKPQGRLLPWEPDAPTEDSDTSDKELSDR